MCVPTQPQRLVHWNKLQHTDFGNPRLHLSLRFEVNRQPTTEFITKLKPRRVFLHFLFGAVV